MFLHSPLTVVERSEHSFDPFPDKGRVLPWGVGCSIVYNYVDLVVRNDIGAHLPARASGSATATSTASCCADEPPDLSYKVEARGEQFLRHDGQVFRRNEIWRRVIDRAHRRSRWASSWSRATARSSSTSPLRASRSSTSDHTIRPRSTTQAG